jgi:hypothetical protein
MKVDSTTHRAVALPGVDATMSARVAVAPQGPKGSALLEVDDGGYHSVTAVEVCPHDGVPDGVLALPEDLHGEQRLADGVRWWLRERPAVEARSVVLELTTAREPERAAREIVSSGLAGALLSPTSDGFKPIVIGGSTYHVKEVRADRGRDGIVRIGPQTSVELFAPGTRAGVDMVILADVSWSMDVADVPKSGGGYLKRIEVLKRSLRALLAERVQAFGPASQVALLAFDTQARQRFPASGGMAQLDAAAPRTVVDGFRKAVDQLAPREGSHTNIERALHSAAELLHKYNRPANKRVIVLVSDGAHCPPRRDEDTGRVFAALEEPVSLMQHLHRDMRIRLHAVGISTKEWFDRRCEPDPTLLPDHRLLQKLLDAGGGGKPTIGGEGDVGGFFSDLAAGLRYPVPGRLSAAAPLRLDPALLRRIAPRQRTPAHSRDVAALRQALGRTAPVVYAASTRLFGEVLFRKGYLGGLESALLDEVPDNDAEFAANLRATLRRLQIVPPQASDVPSVQKWTDLLHRMDRAVDAEGDLSEIARLCRSESQRIPDVAVAVLCTLEKDLQRMARELSKLPSPSAGHAGRPALAGPAILAITPTIPPMRN